MSRGPQLESAGSWVSRLASAVAEPDDVPLVFVVGAGLSRKDGHGVWGVAEVVQYIRDKHGLDPGTKEGAQAYQWLMRALKTKGASHVEKVIRTAVLQAYAGPERKEALRSPTKKLHEQCLSLDKKADGWRLPAGVEALAQLLRHFSDVGHHAAPLVITTNFDGLIEVGLRRLGVPNESYGIVDDEFVREPRDKDVQVWHVHGYWTGSTLHTEDELDERRVKLEAALRKRLEYARVFVVAYGGWDDVVFDGLSTVMKSNPEMVPPDIAWAFFENDAGDVAKHYSHVLNRFGNLLSKAQVQYFGGVDAHQRLQEVVTEVERRLAASTPVSGPATEHTSTSPVPQALRDELEQILKAKCPTQSAKVRALLGLDAATPTMPAAKVVGGGLCAAIKAEPKGSSARKELVETAWAVLDVLCKVLVGDADLSEGQDGLAQSSARTPLFVAVEQAKRQPQPLRLVLVAHKRGARSVNQVLTASEVDLSGVGPIEDDCVLELEKLLWRGLMREMRDTRAYDRARDRATLLGWLDSCALQRDARFGLIDAPGQHDWAQFGRALPGLVFIKLAISSESDPREEHTLAWIVLSLLELTQDEQT